MTNSKESESKSKTARQRSPNYPATSLVDAVSDARLVYEKEKRTLLNQESLVRAMGYTGLNGASRTKVASLRKYGLVDNVGDSLQISQLALRILHQPETSPDYQSAVREAALRPEIFNEFYQSHRDASEQSIQSELIVKRSFSPEGARMFAKAFRETIMFAKLDDVDYSPSNDAENSKDNETTAEPISPPPGVAKPMTSTVEIRPRELPVPIADGLVARVPFPMSEEDFDLLIGTLNLWKKKLVRKLAVVAPYISLPASATWKNNDHDKPVKIVALMGEKNGELYYQSDDGTGIPASQLTF